MKTVFLSTLFASLAMLSACKKDLVDTAENGIEDLNSQQTFDERIANGTSLVFFHASWCSKCKAQRPAFEGASKDENLSFVKFFEVEYEENKEIIDKYNVPGFPTMIIYLDGVEKERFTGTGHSQEKLSNKLQMYM